MKCVVCNSPTINFYAQITKFKTPFTLYRCKECFCVFQHPVPEDADLFYDRDYYVGSADFSYHDERKSEKFKNYVWQARLKTIKDHKPAGRFLDVGCSFGGFVRAASEYYESYGMDVSEYAVTEGNKFGLKQNYKGQQLFHGSLLNLPDHPVFKRKFDIITLIEVWEHLIDPQRQAQAAFNLLNPGGLLVIQTANLEGWQAVNAGKGYHYFLPGHLVCYTATGLKYLLQEAGFNEFKEYIPVDFGLLPKLKKMRGSFSGVLDYFKMVKTSWYHIKSYMKKKQRPLTSSYVLYAKKPLNNS